MKSLHKTHMMMIKKKLKVFCFICREKTNMVYLCFLCPYESDKRDVILDHMRNSPDHLQQTIDLLAKTSIQLDQISSPHLPQAVYNLTNY